MTGVPSFLPSLFPFQEDSGGVSERPVPAAENSKELCAPRATEDAAVAGNDAASDAKGELTPAVAVTPPIPEGTRIWISSEFPLNLDFI